MSSSICFFCFILLKTENNLKNTLLVSILIRNMKNNRRFAKDCFVIRWIVKILHRDVPIQNGRQQRIEPAILGCVSDPSNLLTKKTLFGVLKKLL
jgi:hypothetical protein